jgi:general stress protein 26
MKFKPQTHGPLQQLAACLDGQRVAMLTLRDASDRLVSQPMTPQEMDERGCIWIMLSTGATAQRIGARGAPVNLAFSDERRGTYVSVSGQARLVDDMQRKRALWTELARPWFPGGAEDPTLLLLSIEPEHAEIWDGPTSNVVRALVLSPQPAAAGAPRPRFHAPAR